MYDAELRKVTRKLRFRNALGTLRKKTVYLFGVSDNTRQVIQILRELGMEPCNVIDNDRTKQNSYCARLRVISLDEADSPGASEKIYMIYSTYWREMLPQLMKYGVKRRNIWKLNPAQDCLPELLLKAYRGKRYRERLRKKYGDIPVFLCPYTGSGDIYLIGTFWDEYIRRNHIEDYVFVVITGACKKVASLFDIKNVELVKKKEYAQYLIDYYLYDPEKGKIKLLNDCWAQVHTNQTEWFRGYKGLYFTELFRRFVFDLPDDVRPRHPAYKDESECVRELFNKYGLPPGKTIIISPYSNTLSDLPEWFWEGLVEKLSRKGYCVGTNSGGKTEPAIAGSKEIFFPLDIAPQFIERAGGFIGVRSGLCDVISGTSARKVILYDARNRFYMGSAYEYFSLRRMGLCEDVEEIEYADIDMGNVIDRILRIFIDQEDI